MSDEVKEYTVSPKQDDSFFTTEHWVNKLSNGKVVTVLHVQQHDEATILVELTEEDKEKILASDHIILNDYGAFIDSVETGWFFEMKIKDEESYTDEEKKEIHKLMYCDTDNEDACNSEKEYDFESERMETNGWDMNDTVYEIYGCELEEN